MTYQRSIRPINDTGGTSVNLASRPRRVRRKRRGLGDIIDDFLAAGGITNTGTSTDLVDLANQTSAAGASQSSAIDAVNQAANPGGDFGFVSTTPGICKPVNRATLDAVADLQKALNRIAAVKGFTKIAIDGDLGAGTLGLFRQAQNNSGSSVVGDATNCSTLGADLSIALSTAKSFADRLGAPTGVSSPPPSRTPSFVNPSTGVETAVSNPGTGSITQVLSSMPTPMKLALGGVTLGIGYLLFFDKKKKR